MLCDICSNHPRFHNCFGNTRETGVGISCINAAEMLVKKKDKTYFVTEEISDTPAEKDYDENLLEYIKEIRSMFIEMLQNRERNISERIECLLKSAEFIQNELDNGIMADVNLCNSTYDHIKKSIDAASYKQILGELIPLNDEWSERTSELTNCHFEKAGQLMSENDIISEQLLIYYLFRHMLSSVYDEDLLSKVKFAVFCTWLSFVYAQVCVKSESLTESIVYSACLVSKEIEYCSENIDYLLDCSWTESSMSGDSLISLI